MDEKDGRNRKHEQSTRLSVARRTEVSVSVPAGNVNSFNVVVGNDYRDKTAQVERTELSRFDQSLIHRLRDPASGCGASSRNLGIELLPNHVRTHVQ